MVIDVIFFGILIYTFYVGFSRGIIRTVFTGLSVAVGLLAAIKLTPFVAVSLEKALTASSTVVYVLSFILTFFFVVLIFRLIAGLIEGFIDAADLEMLNKFAGGILFSTLGILVYSGLLIFFKKAELLTPDAVSASAFFPYLEVFPAKLSQFATRIFPFLESLWGSTVDIMDNAKDTLENTDTNNVR
jgi:membrane protein required for colicin V production